MAHTIADRFMDSLDELRRGIRGWTKADHSQYFPIACPQNNHALALYNGSLLSVIRIDGYMGQYFPEQFKLLTEKWAQFLRTASQDKTAKGFDMYWSYEYDPEGMVENAPAYRNRMIAASERRGLNTRDILEEEAKLYGRICADESQYLLIVTHIDSLNKSDQKKAHDDHGRDRKGAIRGAAAMPMKIGIRAIEALHEQHVNKVSVFLESVMMHYSFERLNAYDSLWALRHSFMPGTTSKKWKARLTLNDSRFRATDGVPESLKESQGIQKPNDWTFMLPPPLTDQMVPEGVLDLGRYVVVGDRTYAPMFVSELAVDPQPLEDLLAMCFRRRLPVRMVYSIMSNSKQANYWNRLFASVFTFASASNRQISKADKAMVSYEEGGGSVFGYGIAITTWAKTEVTFDDSGSAFYSVKMLQKRAQDIETFMQQWGGQQVDNIFGCSVEALMSASPGYTMPPACPKAPQIEMDIVSQLPIMRPARLWEPDNSIWMRTKEGVLQPYQPFSSQQTAMLTLVLGGMGYGKSNMLSEHIYYFANHPEAEDMPYIRGIDFGASSSGVIDMIRDSLPEGRKHEAVFETFSNSSNMVKNMMDLGLGLRYPLEDHRKFLVSWLVGLCESLVALAGVSNLVSVLNALVVYVYRVKDPFQSHEFEPVPYLDATADPLVKEAMNKAEVVVDADTNYREIVDDLIKFGLANNDNEVLHAAKIAQRRAVPTFGDLVKACDKVANQFVNMPNVNGTSLVMAISNALLNANSLFPCFVGYTNTDVSESRVCVFDMSEAFGRGNTHYDDWLRSVFFAVVYRLLTEDLFVNKLSSGAELEKNQARHGMSNKLLAWHMEYLIRQDQIIKMFWADEVHRIGKVAGAFEILDSMAFEGRKYRVGLMLGTQMAQHFPKNILELATSVFIFGASQSSESANVLQKIFELSGDERQIVLDITKPDGVKGAEVFVIHKTEHGIQRLKLHFQMGNIKRWAFATEADERALRAILYSQGPSPSWARSTLAKHVPDVKKTIKARQSATMDEISGQEAIRLIANDLLSLRDQALTN